METNKFRSSQVKKYKWPINTFKKSLRYSPGKSNTNWLRFHLTLVGVAIIKKTKIRRRRNGAALV